MAETNKLYVGIDLNYEYAMISIFHKGLDDVETISTVPGEDQYAIPLAIFQTEKGNYYYGAEALRREHSDDGNFYNELYAEALREGESGLYHQMLIRFLQRMTKLIERPDYKQAEVFVGITIPEITTVSVRLLKYVAAELGIEPDHFMILDYAESFYAHTYHQDRSVFIHDTALFDYTNDTITFYLLHKSGNGRIQKVDCTINSWKVPAYAGSSPQEIDQFFAAIVKECLTRRIVSAVYLIGEGFEDGSWLNRSILSIGQNKRVFLGKNLFTKGACYANFIEQEEPDWPLFFDAPYKFRGELRLRIVKDGKKADLMLVEAGRNWFSSYAEYRLLYDGNPNLQFLVQTTENHSITTVEHVLEDLPNRPDRTIRFRVRVYAIDGTHITVVFEDDGFGEFYESSGKSWTFDFSF